MGFYLSTKKGEIYREPLITKNQEGKRIMGLAYDEVKKVRKDFEQQYFFSSPWNLYMNGCRILQVGINDFCISVYLRQPFPPGLLLPEQYLGVRVITQVVGEIIAQ